jgi:ribosomal protein S18 acetylase RimI-like enzyme
VSEARNDGAKSDGAKSDGAKSDGAKSDGAKSDGAQSEQKTKAHNNLAPCANPDGHERTTVSQDTPIDPSPVRVATTEDLKPILAIEVAAFEPSRRSSRASLRRALQSPFQRVFVTEIAGTVAGYLVLWPFRRSWRVYSLAAHPDFSGRGVGGALLDAAVARAREAGVRRVVLESGENPDLLRFYQRRGFGQRRRLPDYYAPGHHALRLELALP